MKCTSMKKSASLLIAALMAAACSNDAPDTPPAEPPRPTMNVQDSLAIVAFYHAMKCGEWKEPFHWDLTDYETWGGITVELDTARNEYRVTEIKVPNAEEYLPGDYYLPPELGNLTRLRSLIVYGDSRMVGEIPKELFDCPLDTLLITGKNDTRTLPEKIWNYSFTNNHRFIVTPENNTSELNPDLVHNWAQTKLIAIYSWSHEEINVTSPWCDGCSSPLPESFRKDIKKENGWHMLFHTFQGSSFAEDIGRNYMCFYHPEERIIKSFYYYEWQANARYLGPKWFIMNYADGKIQLADKVTEGILFFPNKLDDISKLKNSGWNGFLFHVPTVDKEDVNASIRIIN